MKKSFYGFLLGFVVLFGASVFQSCKDTSSDLQTEIDGLNNALTTAKSEIYGKIEEVRSGLQNQIDKIKQCECDRDAVNRAIANAQATADKAKELAANDSIAIDGLTGRVDELTQKVADGDSILNDEIDALSTKLDSLDEAIKNEYATKDSLQDVADSLDFVAARVDNLDTLVAALRVDLDSLCDVVKDLAEKVDSLEDAFNLFKEQPVGVTVQQVWNPVFGSLNTPVGLNTNILMSYYATQGSPEFGLEKGYGFGGKGGKLYVTVDPTNVNFAGKKAALVNSKGEASAVTLDTLSLCEDELKFGLTRAEASNYLYVTEATFDKVELVELNLDAVGLKDAVVDLLKDTKGKDVNGVKADVKQLAKLVATTVADNIPTSLTAYGVEVEDSINSVVSKYEVAALAVKPLNFATFDAIAGQLDALEQYYSYLDAVSAKLQGIDLESIVNGVTKSMSVDVTIKVPTGVDGTTVVTKDSTIKITVDPTIPGLSKVNALQNVVTALISKGLSAVPSLIAKAPAIVNPALLAVYKDNDGLVTVKFLRGDVTLPSNAKVFATSYCLETIVPFYAKTINGDPVPESGLVPLKKGQTNEYCVLDYNGGIKTLTVNVK